MSYTKTRYQVRFIVEEVEFLEGTGISHHLGEVYAFDFPVEHDILAAARARVDTYADMCQKYDAVLDDQINYLLDKADIDDEIRR